MRRDGRGMASLLVSKLTKEYARLQGRYEVIDREIEYVVGVQQILDEIDRIERAKCEMRVRLDQIAAIAVALDPVWQRERVRPIYPRERKAGVLSKVVYRILREAQVPLKTREIARLAAGKLNIEPVQRELLKLETAVANALKPRIGKTIIIASKGPIRWALIPRDQVRSASRRALPATPAPRETADLRQLIAPRPHIQPSGSAVSPSLSLSQTAETLA